MEEETRVSRYKEYRQSFIKEGAIPVSEQDGEISSTTSTLPMGEVLEAVQEEHKKDRIDIRVRRNHRIKIAIKIAIVVLVVVGLVVLGYFAWRK